jgi:hypothetical protein
MSGPVKKKVAVVDKRSNEEIAIQSAMNSNYNVLVPLRDAKYAYIKNPITQKTVHLSTQSEEFFEMIMELCGKGLTEKLREEVISFSNEIDVKWSNVLEKVDERLAVKA